MVSKITQSPDLPFARRPRQGTPSTVSSADPPTSQPGSSPPISDGSKDDSSNMEVTQRSTAASPTIESPTESSRDSSREESPGTPTPSTIRIPQVNLTFLARNDRQTIPVESAPQPYIQPHMRRVAALATDTEEQPVTLRTSQMLLEQMASSHRPHPTWLTAEEEELMAPITMDDIDKMFDDQDDKSHQPHDMASNLSALPESSPFPASKRARHAATTTETSSTRRTRSMTAALAASASPAMNTRQLRSSSNLGLAVSPSPAELAEPESWASASAADKRLSQMKDAGKKWDEITTMWNKETGKQKSPKEIAKRWKRIEGKIGRWPGFDVALRGTTPDVSSGLSAELWQQIAAAVSTQLGWTVSGEECAARFAALQKVDTEEQKGNGKGKGKAKGKGKGRK